MLGKMSFHIFSESLNVLMIHHQMNIIGLISWLKIDGRNDYPKVGTALWLHHIS